MKTLMSIAAAALLALAAIGSGLGRTEHGDGEAHE